jgi:hypothetical protein
MMSDGCRKRIVWNSNVKTDNRRVLSSRRMNCSNSRERNSRNNNDYTFEYRSQVSMEVNKEWIWSISRIWGEEFSTKLASTTMKKSVTNKSNFAKCLIYSQKSMKH